LARILVLDGHAAASLAFTRSLGRAGHWVAVAANEGIFAPAKLSRYCRNSFSYPVSTDDTSAFAATLAEFASSNKIDLIIPITDWTTLPLSYQREKLASIAPVVLPSVASLELAADKYRTVELARSLGIGTPATWLISSLQDLFSLPQMAFPVVVKDRMSVRWVGDKAVFGSVAYAYSREDLFKKVEQRLAVAGDVLIQEFVKGKGIGFSWFSVDGEMRAPFQWERVRETDPRGSGSSARKSVPLEAAIAESSATLIARAGFDGIAMVEFKQKRRGEPPILMEINGRPWGSIQLAIASGVDYPRYVAEWWLSRTKPPKEVPFHAGITCRRMAAELTHLENLRHGTPDGWPVPFPPFWSSLAKIAVPWYPGLRYDDLAAADIRPSAAEIMNWFRVRLGRRAKKN
jgi:predicted ATP-grasp superfamily ATP-dependent carboligase